MKSFIGPCDGLWDMQTWKTGLPSCPPTHAHTATPTKHQELGLWEACAPFSQQQIMKEGLQKLNFVAVHILCCLPLHKHASPQAVCAAFSFSRQKIVRACLIATVSLTDLLNPIHDSEVVSKIQVSRRDISITWLPSFSPHPSSTFPMHVYPEASPIYFLPKCIDLQPLF